MSPRAPKDGYTLLMCTVAQTINPAMNNLSFDFGKDFAPIALIANAPQMLVAHPSFPANNVQELIALAKSQPEGVQYASSGAGTMSHLSGVLLNSAAGIKLQQIPYPGSAQSMTDVLAGRVPLMFGPAATVWSNVQGGKLKALAVTQPKRAAIAPDVPTMVEAGVPGYSAGIWMGLLAPAGTPPEIVDKLSRAANEALKSPEMLSLLEKQGVDPLGGTPAEFAQFIDDELKKWDGVVKAAGIRSTDRGGIRIMRGLKRLGLMVAALLLAAGLAAQCAERLSEQADPLDRRVHAGLGGRHHCARARQPHGPDPRAADRGREQARRGLEPRRRVRRPRAEGRLHAVPARLRQHRQCCDQPQSAVRHRQGLRADRAGQRGGGDPGGASLASAVNNVQELIALAKSKPGELTYASTGLGSAPHFSGELFMQRTGAKLVHVPYPGSPQAATDLLAGRVQVCSRPPRP